MRVTADMMTTYFNSRPSARGDRAAERRRLHPRISIHAPPRGATPRPGKASGMHLISIHAPPRGATACRFLVFCGFPFQFTPLREGRQKSHQPLAHDALFQFTPLREGRREAYSAYEAVMEISIHAPPRGATLAGCMGSRLMQFQFTPLREGRRAAAQPASPMFCSFQFTPLREGRLPNSAHSTSAHLFQFTPLREGRQGRCTGLLASLCISIHAPPRGATRPAPSADQHHQLFQFTPLREGRRQKICNFCKSFVQPLQISMA